MTDPKQDTAKNGEKLHYSVGAVVRRGNKYLLIDRAVPPLGFAGVAGHVDKGETPEQSLLRELKEEVGLTVTSSELLIEEELDWNWCSRGVGTHHWYLFTCETTGDLQRNEREARAADWYTPEEMGKLTLEPVWDYWFKKLEIL